MTPQPRNQNRPKHYNVHRNPNGVRGVPKTHGWMSPLNRRQDR